MNPKTPSPADRDDFDSLPERDLDGLVRRFRAARPTCGR